MQIKANLEIFNSKRDKFGNCYFAFCFTDNETGKKAMGSTTGGESNIRTMYFHLPLDVNEMRVINTEMPIRAFDKFSNSLEYAGCDPKDIAQFVKLNLK